MEGPSILRSNIEYLAVDDRFSTSSSQSFLSSENEQNYSNDDLDVFNDNKEVLSTKLSSGSTEDFSISPQSQSSPLEPSMTSTTFAPPPPPPPPPPPTSIPPPPPPPPVGNLGLKNVIQDEKSKIKLRRLNWEKIPDIQVINADNSIWTGSQSQIMVDFKAIDDLFTVKDKPSSMKSRKNRHTLSTGSLTNGLAESDSSNPDDTKKKINLLDAKRSLNVNIFLRQFKRSVAVLSESIRACDVSFMNSDKLRALLKLLPEKDEIKTLQGFNGNPSSLDTAEHFLFNIISIPFYKIRVEAMLLREEFDHALTQIQKSISVLLQAIKEIRQCYAFPSLLHLVLQAGNYLNRGAAFGNAVGFRLASLKALTDTKANKPGITLMHYVAMELKKNNPEMMSWTEEIGSVDLASRISEEEISEEIKIYYGRVEDVKMKVEDADEELKHNIGEFLEEAEQRLFAISQQEKHLRNTEKDLATYLCENSNKFTLSVCFQIIAEFRSKFTKAAKENLKREEKEKKRNNKANVTECNNSITILNKTAFKETEVHPSTILSSAYNEKIVLFKRSNSMTNQQRRSMSGTKVSSNRSRLRRFDSAHLRRSSLAKPSPFEMKELYEQSSNHNVSPTKEHSTLTEASTEEKKISDMEPVSQIQKHNDQGDRLDEHVRKNKMQPNVHYSTIKEAWADEAQNEIDMKQIQESNLNDLNAQLKNSSSEVSISNEDTSMSYIIESHDQNNSNENLSEQVSRHLDTETNRAPLQNHQTQSELSIDCSSNTINLRHSRNNKAGLESKQRPKSMIVSSSTNSIEEESVSKDDLETSLDHFVSRERERVFERTQLRRSYVRLPKDCNPLNPTDGSEFDTDSRKFVTNNDNKEFESFSTKRQARKTGLSLISSQSDYSLFSSHNDSTDVFSSTASHVLDEELSRDTKTSRHDDIRERIRRYKQSDNNNVLPASELRRSYSCSFLTLNVKEEESNNFNIKSVQNANEKDQVKHDVLNKPLLSNRAMGKSRSARYRLSFPSLSAMHEQQEEEAVNDEKITTSQVQIDDEEKYKETISKDHSSSQKQTAGDKIKTVSSASTEEKTLNHKEKEQKIRSRKNVISNAELSRRDTSLRRNDVSIKLSTFKTKTVPTERNFTSTDSKNPRKGLLPKESIQTTSSNIKKKAISVPNVSEFSTKLSKSSSKKSSGTAVSDVKSFISKLTNSKRKQAKTNFECEKKQKETNTKVSDSTKSSFTVSKTSIKETANKPALTIGKNKSLTENKHSTNSTTGKTNITRTVSPSPNKMQPRKNINVSPSKPASRSSGLVSPNNSAYKSVHKSTALRSYNVTQQQHNPKNVKSSRNSVSPSLKNSKIVTKGNIHKTDVSSKSVSNSKTKSIDCGNTKCDKEFQVTKKNDASPSKPSLTSSKQTCSAKITSNNASVKVGRKETQMLVKTSNIKETNLNDDKDGKPEIAPKMQLDKESVASMNNAQVGVQMNRAARLRMSKKQGSQYLSTKSLVV